MKSFNQIMASAGEKLNFSKQSLKGKNNRFRDEQGFAYTASRILTSLENFADSGSSTKFSLDSAILNL